MAYTTKVAEYFRDGGATNDEMDDLFHFCRTFKDGAKKKPIIRYIYFWQDC